MPASRVTIFLLVGGALGAACSNGAGGDGETVCYDCGECGIQGPVDPGSIFINEIGVDGEGNAAVGLDLQEGPCPGDDQIDFRVLYAAGVVTVVPEPANDPIDRSAVSIVNLVYTWNDRDLTLTTSNVAKTAELTFTEMGASVKASCTGVDREIVCTTM